MSLVNCRLLVFDAAGTEWLGLLSVLVITNETRHTTDMGVTKTPVSKIMEGLIGELELTRASIMNKDGRIAVEIYSEYAGTR